MLLERQDLSCTYPAHHELDSVVTNIVVVFINIVTYALDSLQAKYLPAKGKPGCESCTSDAFKQSLTKYQEKCGRFSKTNVVANLQQVCWKHQHHHLLSFLSSSMWLPVYTKHLVYLPALGM